MTSHLYFAFVAAVTVLMLIPGPNMALIVANSVSHGARYGLLTVAGTVSAQVVQLSLVAFGLAAFLGAMGSLLGWVRWLGVAYLVYLAIKQWRAPPADLLATQAQPRNARRMFLRAVMVSMANPKTLFFYGAFLPQFINPDANVMGQVALLAGTFLVVAATVDGGYALLAARARALLSRHAVLRNRVSGGFLFGAAVGLAAVRET